MLLIVLVRCLDLLSDEEPFILLWKYRNKVVIISNVNRTEWSPIRSVIIQVRGYSRIWPIRGRAAGQGMFFFGLAVLDKVYKITHLCPKQGQNDGQNLSTQTGCAYTICTSLACEQAHL